jgi:hypothetical protein
MRLTRASIVFLFLGTAVLVQAQQYVISTFAGGTPPLTPVLGVNMALQSLQSVATDPVGSTYFVALHCVFKLDQNGVVTRIAGNGRAGYSGDGGPATSAELRLENTTLPPPGFPLQEPPGLVVDHSGNVYVADNGNYRIRRISLDGIITTVAVNGTPGFSGDGGPATSAQLSSVPGLAVDLAGNLWIADNGSNRVRQVRPDGTIATIAGTGTCGFSGDGGPAVTAQICSPVGIAAGSDSNVFIADSGNTRVRRISPDGTITTVAGVSSDPTDCSPGGDGGPATSAAMCLPGAVAVDPAGNLFVSDFNGYATIGYPLVRKVSPSGTITTVAGWNCSLAPLSSCYNVAGLGTSATKTLLGAPLAWR